jgi:hypothetical protein
MTQAEIVRKILNEVHGRKIWGDDPEEDGTPDSFFWSEDLVRQILTENGFNLERWSISATTEIRTQANPMISPCGDAFPGSRVIIKNGNGNTVLNVWFESPYDEYSY